MYIIEELFQIFWSFFETVFSQSTDIFGIRERSKKDIFDITLGKDQRKAGYVGIST